jgi:predicted  nucleic acid-binding Zn-ribbon protein
MSSEEVVHTVVTHDDLSEVKARFQSDLVGLREQISILQARAAAVESQIARIEPMVEARASRTEKIVMELQVEMHKLTKTLEGKDTKAKDQYANIEKMLHTILERTEGGSL